jgi:dienelactone hydrolase
MASPVYAQDEAKPAVTPLPSAPPWSVLKAAYDYNSKLMVIVKEKPREDPEVLLIHITLTNRYGQPVTGLFMRPKAEGVYPCVLLLHGSGGSKDGIMGSFGRTLAKRGLSSLALDASRHGERQDQEPPTKVLRKTAGWVSRVTLVDYRIAMDYLAERKDVDSKHIGLVGYSMGSQMGAVLAGVDERIKAVLLCVGGDPIRPLINSVPEEQRENIEFASPSNYIGHISPRPLLMLNGTKDDNINAEMTKLLYDATREPREIRWAESGHSLPRPFVEEGLDWLAVKLGKKPKE